MEIIVCIKQVQDPDIPPRDFKVDEERMAVIPPSSFPLVINTFDENAVEEAIRLKEAHQGKITIVTVGSEKARDSLKKCLAMGCDEAILLQDEAFEGSDAFGVARILAGPSASSGSMTSSSAGASAATGATGRPASPWRRRSASPASASSKKSRSHRTGSSASGRSKTASKSWGSQRPAS